RDRARACSLRESWASLTSKWLVPTGCLAFFECPPEPERPRATYLPSARRWKRVRFSIFLCFFLRMRLRRFLISDPMARRTLLGFQRGQNEGFPVDGTTGGR